MALRRRRFLKILLGTGALMAGPLGFFKERLPLRFVRAFRCRSYPGQVKCLDENEVAKPGRWAG